MRTYSAKPTEEVPVASDEQLPKLGNDENSRNLKKDIFRFSQLVNELSPMLDGETMEPDSDVFTFLVAPFLDFPIGTPILKRTTNRAVLYYFYSYAHVDKGGAVSYFPQTEDNLPGRNIPELSSEPITYGVPNAIWATLLLELVKGIVGEIGSRIGSQAIDAIFPFGKNIDYKTMLNDFAVLIAEANRNQTISEQGGLLNGIVQNHGEYYMPRRKTAKKEELYQQLLNYHNGLAGICGTLSYKNGTDYTQSGLALYVHAVSFHLAIYQEMALQDPNAASPQTSSNIQSIIYLSRNAASYAEKKCNEIFNEKLNNRLNKISGILNNPYCNGNVCKSRFYFRDSEKGFHSGYYEQSGCDDNPGERCDTARTRYYNARKSEKSSELNNQLAWIREITPKWKLLESKPLP